MQGMMRERERPVPIRDGKGTGSLALVGHGRMGSLLRELACERGLRVEASFDSAHPLSPEAAESLPKGTVLVDFSQASALLPTVRLAATHSLHVVVGTTGWGEHLEEVRRLVEEGGIGLVYGANFSLGANLFYRIVEAAARAFSATGVYETYVLESHHRLKKDSPSGTALRLAEILARQQKGIQPPVCSLRAGNIPGTHEVGFDSPADTIRLEHQARDRRGLAEGALLAARWIAGHRGFHEFRQVLDELQ